MTRRSPPPRPTSVLTRLFERLRAEAATIPIDPELPRRVEQRIREERPRTPETTARLLPRWAAVAAALLLALGVGTSAGSRPAAVCGPVEAEQRWEQTKAVKYAPWPVQVRAYRAVLTEAHPTDRLHRRALETLARALRKVGLVHAAAALEAQAAGLGPSRDRGRLGSLLSKARGLRSEGDLEAAAVVLEEAATLARSIAPTMADRARAWQADDAADAGDLPRLEALAHRLAAEKAGLPLRLEVAGALGCLRLAQGDERGARRALDDAKRLYGESLRRDDETAARCAKLWLDLELRDRLPANR